MHLLVYGTHFGTPTHSLHNLLRLESAIMSKVYTKTGMKRAAFCDFDTCEKKAKYGIPNEKPKRCAGKSSLRVVIQPDTVTICAKQSFSAVDPLIAFDTQPADFCHTLYGAHAQQQNISKIGGFMQNLVDFALTKTAISTPSLAMTATTTHHAVLHTRMIT
jgi:hypothetical protein